MEKVQSAEDFLQDHLQISHFYDDNINQMVCYSSDVQKAMIEFAKLHVEAALKKASEKVSVFHENYNGSHQIEFPYTIDDYSDLHLDKSSILNSYPLENIK